MAIKLELEIAEVEAILKSLSGNAYAEVAQLMLSYMGKHYLKHKLNNL